MPDELTFDDEAVSQLRWLTTADIAAILGVSRQTIYNHLATNPDSLPPVTKIPGWRGPRWSMKIVREWQALHDPPTVALPPRRVGRPRKAEAIARRKQFGLVGNTD
jgi:predicted DNA-binding transcriptional regulator AlpA